MVMSERGERRPRILLAGSSHVRFFFPYVSDFLGEKAVVSRLLRDAGRTDEILNSLAGWPLEGMDVVYLYAGHRDLMFREDEEVFISLAEFEHNFRTIITAIQKRTDALIVLSTLPPVASALLAEDAGRNQRIHQYNAVIERIANENRLPVHDFRAYVLQHERNEDIYLDGLHFTRQFYREFGKHLGKFLIERIHSGGPR
jgi:lysophospholipase L1-like esterase